jgi:hypothetical protein
MRQRPSEKRHGLLCVGVPAACALQSAYWRSGKQLYKWKEGLEGRWLALLGPCDGGCTVAAAWGSQQLTAPAMDPSIQVLCCSEALLKRMPTCREMWARRTVHTACC